MKSMCGLGQTRPSCGLHIDVHCWRYMKTFCAFSSVSVQCTTERGLCSSSSIFLLSFPARGCQSEKAQSASISVNWTLRREREELNRQFLVRQQTTQPSQKTQYQQGTSKTAWIPALYLTLKPRGRVLFHSKFVLLSDWYMFTQYGAASKSWRPWFRS